jgi:anti-sigma B factor antagonist
MDTTSGTTALIEARVEDRVLIARVLPRRLDASVAPQFKADVVKEIEAGHRRVVLDLGGVDFMDSSALGALVSCVKTLGGRGDMAISGAHGAVAKLFKLTRLDRVLRLHDSVEEAAAAVRT